MSDYSSTYTESTGDKIDTSDFSTEFNAIETAIATKLDVDSDTATNFTIGSGYGGGALVRATALPLNTLTHDDFRSIPSWVQRITVNYVSVSCAGATAPRIQLGVAGTPVTSGYTQSISELLNATAVVSGNATDAFHIGKSAAAGNSYVGSLVLELLTPNVWIAHGSGHETTNKYQLNTSGGITLAGTLDMIRFTTDGVDTFDAGTVAITYEG